MATCINANKNEWYSSKCKRLLKFVYQTRINQFSRFVEIPTRFYNFYTRVSFKR